MGQSRLERLWNLRSGPFRETIHRLLPGTVRAVLFFVSQCMRKKFPWRPLTHHRDIMRHDVLCDPGWVALPSRINPADLCKTMAFHGHIGGLRQAVERGMVVDNEVFACAAQSGDVSVLRFASFHWAVTDYDLHYPMVCAASAGSLECVRFLYEHVRSSFSRIDRTKHPSVVQGAVRSGNIHVLTYLLDRGYPVDEGAQYFAVTYGHLHLLKELVRRGYRVCNDAARWAARRNHLDIMRYLVRDQHIQCEARDLVNECWEGDSADVLRFILDEYKHDPTPWDANLAARYGVVDCLRLLLDRYHVDGSSACWFAVYYQRVDALRCLYEFGFTPTVRDAISLIEQYEDIPSILGCEYIEQNHARYIQVLQVLIDHGMRFSRTDVDGLRGHWSTRVRTDIVQFLEDSGAIE